MRATNQLASRRSPMNFFSRAGQDQFLFDHFFRGRRDGVFVDVGASDGEKFSNSLFFERFLGWSGLCIEPTPAVYAKLAAQRKCRCEQLAATGLAAALDKHSLAQIDYCSIAAPGSELAVLSSLDLRRINISLISVTSDDERVPRLLAEHGYELLVRL